ncbi:glycosyltransferase [Synechocystis salina]|uniref:glycosyltransferase n=1 Tax=Synechocystis salina TaxID=945780 RepID=UPI001D15D7BD|nr:glycosyltransferase [Synechocystis salina]
MLHNRYQYVGGEDVSTQTEIAILRQFWHQVTYLEEHNDRIKQFSSLDKIRLFLSTAWNHQEAKSLGSQLQTLRPDLLHVQNFFPLFSPSVHKAAKSLDIPTIQHLRNFRLGCLNGYLYRNNDICESCIGHNPWRGVAYRCYRNSLPSSLAVWNMITYSRWRCTWQNDVDAFITPSQFAANKLIEIGIPDDRLYIKPNITADPLPNQQILPPPQRPTFLFIGRLSPEKGAMTLIKAWEKLKQPEWHLNILGGGPQKPELEGFADNYALSNIRFLGYQSQKKVVEAINNATVIVVPSQWYEIFGRVVIEAFACGRPVIVSNLGALPEIVDEGKTGFIVPATNINAWTELLEWCSENPSILIKMGQKARQVYSQKYTPEINYQQLMSIYHQVLY